MKCKSLYAIKIRVLVFTLCLFLPVFNTVYAENVQIVKTTAKPIRIMVNDSLLLKVRGRISSIFTTDPTVLEYQMPTPDSRNIFVFGRKQGVATLYVMDSKGNPIINRSFIVRGRKFISVCGNLNPNLQANITGGVIIEDSLVNKTRGVNSKGEDKDKENGKNTESTNKTREYVSPLEQECGYLGQESGSGGK